MNYSQVDVKMTRRLPVLQGEKGPRIFHEYHDLSNELFQKWNGRLLVFLSQKVLRRFEFSFYVASNTPEDVGPHVRTYVECFGGDIGKLSIEPITEDTFIQGLARARYMGYLRNGTDLHMQLESKEE